MAGTTDNEDAAIVRIPEKKVLVQTVDFFTPVVNNPYLFGQIAAANALSDVYAMGGEPWTVMNILCFPIKDLPEEILVAILAGGAETITEAGAALVGGHSVEDDTIKYGLSVTGIVDADCYARNAGLCEGDVLIATKPIGSGILATAVKADWDGAEGYERELGRWASHLNKVGGSVIASLGLRAATDVTGFGLGGHLIEMANASGVSIVLESGQVPLMEGVLELAAIGLLPAGSHDNRRYFSCSTRVEPHVTSLMVDILFDAQTSGGLILAVPEKLCATAVTMLESEGEIAAIIGTAVSRQEQTVALRIV